MAAAVHPSDAVYASGISVDGKPRRDRRSALKKVLDRTDDPQNIVACPYGCRGVDQDRRGYCQHLIGFCNHLTLPDGEVKRLPAEPVVVELVASAVDEHGRRPMTGEKDVLKKGDYLVRVTHSLRVYRFVDPKVDPKVPPPKPPAA